MGDRLYDNLEFAYSQYCVDDYNEDVDGTEEEYDQEEEVNDDVEPEVKLDELACPFCYEDFDVLGLCCHVDADHRMEVKPQICPICSMKVRINMASHVITQHESILKTLCNKKHGTARSRSAILVLRKDLQEKHLFSIKETSYVGSYSDAASDSRLLSFVNNTEPTYKRRAVEAVSSAELNLPVESSSDNLSERTQPSATVEKNDERAKRCEFVKGLVFSTILDNL